MVSAPSKVPTIAHCSVIALKSRHPDRDQVLKKFKKINIVSQLYDVLLEYQMNLLRIATLKRKIINYGND